MSVVIMLLATWLVPEQLAAMPEYTDSRVQTAVYSPGQVVTLSVARGYAAVVELGTDERVDSVIVGNSAAWQVTASQRGDSVVVKPLGEAVPTNMIVITGERRYVFLLQPGGTEAAGAFVLRFSYPEAAAAAPPASTAATFKWSGAKTLYPIAMRDDGHRTFITWGRSTALPAIFASGRDDREMLVNGRMVGGDYVVEGVAARYTFRLGHSRAVALRQPVGTSR